MRILDQVREVVEEEKKQQGFLSALIRPWELAERLNVKQKVIDQACSVLQKEGVLSTHRSALGAYYVKTPPLAYRHQTTLDSLTMTVRPRKQRVSWGAKRRLLPIIRKTKPWVVEVFYPEPDSRWYMYMDFPAGWGHISGTVGVAAEDQPTLTRAEIAKNHYDMAGALQKCAELRRKFPKRTFRIRDTSQGDYIMGAIL